LSSGTAGVGFLPLGEAAIVWHLCGFDGPGGYLILVKTCLLAFLGVT
jgi:hypothetical protein